MVIRSPDLLISLYMFAGVFFGALAMGWFALIVQSLSSAGKKEPYFASSLDFANVPDNESDVQLTADFVFVDSNGVEWIAPKGMESDGASVGSLLRWPFLSDLVTRLIQGGPLEGPLRSPAITHDGIYARATDETFWPALISAQRALADRVIYEAAQTKFYRLTTGKTYARRPLAKWRAFVVIAMLRIAGFKAWIADSRASESLKKKADVLPFPQKKA